MIFKKICLWSARCSASTYNLHYKRVSLWELLNDINSSSLASISGRINLYQSQYHIKLICCICMKPHGTLRVLQHLHWFGQRLSLVGFTLSYYCCIICWMFCGCVFDFCIRPLIDKSNQTWVLMLLAFCFGSSKQVYLVVHPQKF